MPTVLIRGDVFFWQLIQAAAILDALPITERAQALARRRDRHLLCAR